MRTVLVGTGRPRPYWWSQHHTPHHIDVWDPYPLGGLDLGARTFDHGWATAGLVSTLNHHADVAGLFTIADAIASARLEGVHSPVAAVTAVASRPPANTDIDVAAANIDVARTALRAAGQPIDAAAICEWHRTLCTPSSLRSDAVGAPRDVVCWIGGWSPEVARFVPPAPEQVPGLLAEWCDWINTIDVDPFTAAAAAHVTFETIHPFADGNGRIGRALLNWCFAHRTGTHITPMFAAATNTDRNAYYDALNSWRHGGDQLWAWFADLIDTATEMVADFAVDAAELRARFDVRNNPTRAVVVDRVFDDGGIRVADLARTAGISERAASKALHTFADEGLLAPADIWQPPTRGKTPAWWTSPDLDALIDRTAGRT